MNFSSMSAHQNLAASLTCHQERNGRNAKVSHNPLLHNFVWMMCAHMTQTTYCQKTACSGFSTMPSSKPTEQTPQTVVAGKSSSWRAPPKNYNALQHQNSFPPKASLRH